MPWGKSPVRTTALQGRPAQPRIDRGAAREEVRFGTKPECALESVIKEAWYTFLMRIRLDDRRRTGRVFWVHPHWDSPPTAPDVVRSPEHSGAQRKGLHVWEQSRNVPWNQSLRRRGTPSYCGFGLTTAGK